jgi:hypothetical protein
MKVFIGNNADLYSLFVFGVFRFLPLYVGNDPARQIGCAALPF